MLKFSTNWTNDQFIKKYKTLKLKESYFANFLANIEIHSAIY